MPKKINSTIVIALCAAAALIALALDKQYGGYVTLSAAQLDIAAALICLGPVFFALIRCQVIRKKTLIAG
jgi:hypothetical protein